MSNRVRRFEHALVVSYERWDTYAERLGPVSDSKQAARDRARTEFHTNFAKLIAAPESLTADLAELAKLIEIHTSEDGSFRSYSWDAGGGTGRISETWFQYRSESGVVKAFQDFAPCTDCFGPPLVRNIAQTSTKPYMYVVFGSVQICSSCVRESISVWKIDQETIVPTQPKIEKETIVLYDSTK